MTSVNYCVNIRWGIIEPPRYANMTTGQKLSPIPSASEPPPRPSLDRPLPRGIIKSLQGNDIQDKGGVQTLMRDDSDRYRALASARLALSRHSLRPGEGRSPERVRRSEPAEGPLARGQRGSEFPASSPRRTSPGIARHCFSNRYSPRLELPVTPFPFNRISNSNRRITRSFRPPWRTAFFLPPFSASRSFLASLLPCFPASLLPRLLAALRPSLCYNTPLQYQHSLPRFTWLKFNRFAHTATTRTASP